MKANIGTEKMISDLVNASCGKHADARQKHVFRETLRQLVRLAKAEQLFEMKMNVKKLTAPLRETKKHSHSGHAAQTCFQYPLEFHRSN